MSFSRAGNLMSRAMLRRTPVDGSLDASSNGQLAAARVCSTVDLPVCSYLTRPAAARLALRLAQRFIARSFAQLYGILMSAGLTGAIGRWPRPV